MTKTIAQLHTEAQTIRDETVTAANTATRVGGCIDDVVDFLGDVQSIIGSKTYNTELILNDFTTNGYYKIDNNDLVFDSSANWLYKIVPIDDLANTTAVGVRSDWYNFGLVNIPPIIYLSGDTPTWANYISHEYGTVSVGTGLADNFKRLGSIAIPVNATHALIQNTSVYGADSTITYQQDISIDGRVTKLEKRFVLVDKNGRGMFTTISAAVLGTNNGDTIIVNAGTYEEDVHMWGKTRHIVGVDRDACILTNGTGAYATPPLEANIGSISNMTIIADNYDPTIPDPTQNQVLPSYGIHIEYANSTPYTLSIRNCKIVSKWCAALGIGLRYNQTVEIIDCELISECVRIYSNYAGHWVEMGGLFFHNDGVSNNAGTGKLYVRNSRLQGKKAALVMEAVNKTPLVDAEFACNTLISEDYGVGSGIIYRYDNMPTVAGYLCGNKITLGIASHANNIAELNA